MTEKRTPQTLPKVAAWRRRTARAELDSMLEEMDDDPMNGAAGFCPNLREQTSANQRFLTRELERRIERRWGFADRDACYAAVAAFLSEER